MPVISEMFAYVAEDRGPQDEGVAAFLAGNTWMPLVAADKARVEQLRTVAQEVCNASGKKLRLVRFSVREELEVLDPK